MYIIYYILDSTGYKMARSGIWSIWYGTALAPVVLIPTAAFVTYKASHDSMVFNLDLWRSLAMRVLGLRLKRHVPMKEVVVDEPDYRGDAEQLAQISREILEYSRRHRLRSAPNVIKVFFKYSPDHAIEKINARLEEVIEDLSNTRDVVIINEMNFYPYIATKAHTRPFERRWLNILAALCLPLGLFLYIRMWQFRIRLFNDLRDIQQANANIISRIEKIV